MNVWNTFSNSRGYAMAQLASMVDPTIVKNEGLFNAVEMIIPEKAPSCSLRPTSPRPWVRSIPPRDRRGDLHRPLGDPARALLPQVYKLGMPNAVIGFDDQGQMWLDQGVDVRASDASATQGLDGWGSMCSGLGNLMALAEAEDAESRFPVINLNRELTTDTGGAGRWRGQPGTLNVKKVLEPTMAVAWMVSMKPTPCAGFAAVTMPAPTATTSRWGAPNEYKIDNSVQADLPAGAVIAYQYGGGAGFESPLLRDPEAGTRGRARRVRERGGRA